jgi:hypothetical protein
MKKALRDLGLFAVATAGLLFLFAIITVAFQIPNKIGLDHSSISNLISLAFAHIKDNIVSFLRWGLILFLAFPIVMKTLLHKRHLRWNMNSDVPPVHTAPHYEPGTSYRSVDRRPQTYWEQISRGNEARVADSGSIQRRRVS